MNKANSPIYVNVPVVSPINGQIADSIKFFLVFWDGIKTNQPFFGTPNSPNVYSFTKLNKVGNSFLQMTGDFTFDVAEFLQDTISFNIPPSLLTNVYTVNNTIWWNYVVNYFSVSGGTLDYSETVKSANFGYSYGNEAANIETPINRILMETDVKYAVGRNSTFNIPILAAEAGNTTISYSTSPTNSYNGSVVIPATIESAQIQKNVIFDISEISDDETQISFTCTTSANTSVITVDIIDECKETPVDLAFINKEGGLQFLTFFKSNVRTLSVDNESFNSRNGRASDGYHQNKIFDVTGKVSTKINSGFIDESLNTIYKQLLLSSLVWEITVDKKFNPITITTKSLSFKTRLNDKLLNYEISYENAYNEIQQY